MNLTKIKKITSKDIKGQKFGDFIALEVIDKDKSRHNIWLCECPECKKTIRGTVYDLTHNRINLKCDCNQFDKVSVDEDNKNIQRVFYTEEKIDIFSLGVYYNIAYCLTSDCKGHSALSKEIISLFNLENCLTSLNITSEDVGHTFRINNTFTMIASKPYEKATLETISNCIEELACLCYSFNVKYLGMPFVGCGKNGLEWKDVKPLILKIFNKVFTDKTIEIVFCYV